LLGLAGLVLSLACTTAAAAGPPAVGTPHSPSTPRSEPAVPTAGAPQLTSTPRAGASPAPPSIAPLAADAGASARLPNVLLISFDTLRADHVPLTGEETPTPSLRSLARQGTGFARAYAHTATTAPSHATLMTSLYPTTHGVTKNGVKLDPAHETLAEILRANGYRTVGFVAALPLWPSYGWSQGFDEYFAANAEPGEKKGRSCRISPLQRCGEDVADQALAWLRGHGGGDRPFFAFVHFYDAHAPYDAPEGTKRGWHTLPQENPRCRGRPCQPFADAYAAEVRWVDAQAGRVLAWLDENGLAADTLVIVVADHGEAFSEHGYWGHEIDLHEELVRVPLLFRWPGRIAPGRVRAEPVGLVDVLPTVLDLLDVDASSLPLQGRSLAAAVAGSEPLPATSDIFFERVHYDPGRVSGHEVAGTQRGILFGRWKYTEAREEDRRALYDLDADPGETLDVAGERRRETATLSVRLLRRWKAIQAAAPPRPSPVVSAEDRARLRALGYTD
jgi:arylsulfatase A-like enzyme